MKDMLGNELVKGDFVTYGARAGNSGQLRLGIIINPEKGSILTGTGYYRTYNPETRQELPEKEYYFRLGIQPGHGVDGDKLLKLPQELYPEIYNQLKERASRWL